MSDTGYANYRDPRLIPPDVGHADGPTPAEVCEECAHSGACLRTLRMLGAAHKDVPYSYEQLARMLGCDEDCEEFDECEI